MGRVAKIARRTFLFGAAALGGGFAVGAYFHQRDPGNPIEDGLAEGEATFSPYLKIGPDNTITIYTGRAEMGQGAATSLPALVAEELDVDLDQIVVEHGPPSSAYGNAAVMETAAFAAGWSETMFAKGERGVLSALGVTLGLQATGGSSSVMDGFDKMRKAGAIAREMLKTAAAERLGAPLTSLRTERGAVHFGDQSVAYGDVAAAAAGVQLSREPELRTPRNWRIIGKSQKRTDLRAKVTGAPIFGIDVDLPGMVYGAVRMSPRFGAGIRSFDVSAAQAAPGVSKVVEIEAGGARGFGVIADNTWSAFQAAAAISVEWEAAPYPGTVDEIMADYGRALDEASGFGFRDDGDALSAIASAPEADVITAEYRAPFLAHACLEPMNATAQFTDGALKIWAPTQAPSLALMAAAAESGLSEKDIDLTVTMLGGGFGRRLESDFIRYAVALAKHADGRPVKVTWTREEDQTHDTYRPAALARMKAVASPGADPSAVFMKIASPSVLQSMTGRTLFTPSVASPDKYAVEGAFDQPVGIRNFRVEAVHPAQTLPVGFWRSVGHSYSGFFHEGFMDEIAVAAGIDPVEMRLRLMADHRPARLVIEKVAEMSGWGRNPGPNKGLGVAFTHSYGASCAQVIEVTDGDGGISIDRAWCAVDVGIAVDPDAVARQMTSGMVFGLSSAIGQKITLADGEVRERNFWDFDSMRMAQCPRMEVAVLENADRIGGAGEPGTPPSIPALGNAIFAATGRRLRSLPFSDEVGFA